MIVPVYNVEPYLAECVDSLVEQTVDDYEIILVDDGSTDGSGAIADGYAERYPRLIRTLHIDNGGQGRARNIAMDTARGDYLGFVDSDDWVDRDMYKKLLAAAESTGADVVVCDFMSSFVDGREEYLPACLQDHRLASAGSSCNKIFRRTAIGDIRFPTGLWYEDFYFSAMLLLKSARTEFLEEPLYIYRRGQESTMHNNNARKNLDMLRIMDMLEEYMLPNGFREDFEFLLVNHVVLDSISRLAQQDSPEAKSVIRELRDYVKKRIPRITACGSFREESLKRRIIMYLNYNGMEALSQLVLKLNRAL